jgi:hypothetical protein
MVHFPQKKKELKKILLNPHVIELQKKTKFPLGIGRIQMLIARTRKNDSMNE